jgi:hypothetical protein
MATRAPLHDGRLELMRLAYLTVVTTFAVLCLLLASDRDKDTQNLVLRHEVAVLKR